MATKDDFADLATKADIAELRTEMNTTLDHSLLEAALEGLTLKRERLIAQIAEVRRQLGSSLPARAPSSAAEPNSKRTMSAAGRRAIAEAQRKRWAAQKKEETKVAKPKRKLSAAGRRAIAQATRKRWAAVREARAAALNSAKATDKKSPKTATKKTATTKKSVKTAAKPRAKASAPVQPEAPSRRKPSKLLPSNRSRHGYRDRGEVQSGAR